MERDRPGVAGESRRALDEQRVDPLDLRIGRPAHFLSKCLAPRPADRHADRMKWIARSARVSITPSG
jgi:hypothetical protein